MICPAHGALSAIGFKPNGPVYVVKRLVRADHDAAAQPERAYINDVTHPVIGVDEAAHLEVRRVS